ncbi:MAG: tetratricopeptide repeat protein [Candidatus Zixiibacteriota bacterium]
MKRALTICLLSLILFAVAAAQNEKPVITITPAIEQPLLEGRWEKVYNTIKDDSIRVDDPVSRLLMGHACLSTQRNYGATKLFSTVTEPSDIKKYFDYVSKLANDNPDNAIAAYLAGDGYLRRGDYDSAIAGFTRAIEINHLLTIAYFQRGNTYELALGNKNNAIADYKSAIQINPRYARAYLNLGNIYHDRGDLESALKYYDDAVMADSQYSQAFFNRANVYFEQKEFDKAILEYDKAIMLRPLWSEAYYNRANVYLFGKEEWVNAIFDYDKAINFNTSYIPAIRNRGVARSRNGEFAQAIADFTRVLQLKEDDAEAFSNRGNCWVQMGDYDKALNDYNQAIHFDPRLAEAYENRGFLYMVHMNNKEKACADWKKACDLGRCDNYRLAQKNGDCE